MQDTDSISSWKSQLRKGAAELAVLALLRRGEAYGLEILQALTHAGQLEISEGSIYPLLKRLEKGGKIQARWKTIYVAWKFHPGEVHGIGDVVQMQPFVPVTPRITNGSVLFKQDGIDAFTPQTPSHADANVTGANNEARCVGVGSLH